MLTTDLTTEVLERVVRAATRAPSLHNTQPWTVEVGRSRGRGTVDVRLDPARSLRHSDPSSREATISCGVLVDHLVVAARREGLDVTVSVPGPPVPGPPVPRPPVPGPPVPGPQVPGPPVPGPSRSGSVPSLARLVLVHGAPPSVAELELSVAAVHRRTTRTALDDLPVDADLVARLVQVVADAQAHLVVLSPGSAAREVLLRQVVRAEALATEDLVGLAEEEAWTGHAGADPRPGSRRLSERLEPQDAGDHGAADHGGGRAGAAAHRAVLALLTTPGDSRDDWLRAGRALSRVLLAATVDGLTASFATTVLENPTTRHEVVRSLGLVSAPQVLLQLGYGEPGVRTPRRTLSTSTSTGDDGGGTTA